MPDFLGRGRMGVSAEALARQEKERRRNPGGWAANLLGGPSVAEQMQGLDTAQRAAIKRGGVRDLLGDPEVQARATDVASNLDFTGTFGGVKAKTAPLHTLQRAENMAHAGTDPAAIWEKTGWFQGPDKQWRFEIDDSKSKVLDTPESWDARVNASLDAKNVPVATAAPLESVFSHPELERAYFPTRETAPSVFYDDLGKTEGAYYRAGQGGAVKLNSSLPLSPDKERSVMLHELQHGLQEREGFAKGGNPTASAIEQSNRLDALKAELAETEKAMWEAGRKGSGDYVRLMQKRIDLRYQLQDAKLAQLSPYEAYRRLAGETEARAVQARRDLLPEQRRARPPWLDYDVPPEQQIVLGVR